MQKQKNVSLILDDGSRFSGISFGYERPTAGEVVFNTAMSGYPGNSQLFSNLKRFMPTE